MKLRDHGMTMLRGLSVALSLSSATIAYAQPSYVAAAPVPAVVEDAAERRSGYLARVDEVISWRASQVKPPDFAKLGLADIATKLALRQDAEACSAAVV